MTNFGVIETIEYFHGGQWRPLPIRNSSGTFEEKESQGAGGRSYKSTLKFKISGFSRTNETPIRELRLSPCIRVTDVNSWRITLGTGELPVKIKIDRSIDGTPGSFRGNDVTVTWESAEPAPGQSFI